MEPDTFAMLFCMAVSTAGALATVIFFGLIELISETQKDK